MDLLALTHIIKILQVAEFILGFSNSISFAISMFPSIASLPLAIPQRSVLSPSIHIVFQNFSYSILRHEWPCVCTDLHTLCQYPLLHGCLPSIHSIEHGFLAKQVVSTCQSLLYIMSIIVLVLFYFVEYLQFEIVP